MRNSRTEELEEARKTSSKSKKRPGTGESSSILLRMQEVQKIQPTKETQQQNKTQRNKNTLPKNQPKKRKTQPNKNLTLIEGRKLRKNMCILFPALRPDDFNLHG